MKSVVEIFLLGSNGWTRAQYALFRVVLGVHLLITSLLLLRSLNQSLTILLAGASALLSVLLIFGVKERIVAFGLAGLWALFFGVRPTAPHHADPMLVYLLLAHTELAPTTRGDISDAAEWRMPQPIFSLIWIIAVAFFTWNGASILLGVDYPAFTVLYLAAPLALFPPLRPYIWGVTLFVALYLIAALGDVVLSMLLLQLYLFDPRWVPGRSSGAAEKLFYDGDCGLCHRAVMFVLEEDRTGALFRFSPLGGESFLSAVASEKRAALPDSIVVLTESGDVLTKSRAVAHIGRSLGGLWRIFAAVLRLIPHRIADLGYDLVARYRKQIFRKPAGVCPIVPASLSDRFLP